MKLAKAILRRLSDALGKSRGTPARRAQEEFWDIHGSLANARANPLAPMPPTVYVCGEDEWEDIPEYLLDAAVYSSCR